MLKLSFTTFFSKNTLAKICGVMVRKFIRNAIDLKIYYLERLVTK